jgi:hypothetical protein
MSSPQYLGCADPYTVLCKLCADIGNPPAQICKAGEKERSLVLDFIAKA